MIRTVLFLGLAGCASLTLSAACALTAAAEETDGASDLLSLSLEELLEIEVTLSTKTPETLERGPASMSVFTQREIGSLGLRYLSELLDLVPGFDVRRYREPLDLIDVRGISGQFNERILIMMDGVRLNDIYNGGTARSVRAIRLDNAERVEIIRGPGSVLYGTDAFAAVINITTLRGADVDGLTVAGELGSSGRRGGGILGGRRFGDHDLQASFSITEGDGETYKIGADAVGRSGEVVDSFEELSGSLRYDYGDRVSCALSGGMRNERGFVSLSDVLGDTSEENRGTWCAGGVDLLRGIADDLDWTTKLYGAFNRWESVMNIWPAGFGPAADPDGPYALGLYGHPELDDWRFGFDSAVTWRAGGTHNLIVGFAFEREETDNLDYYSNGPAIATTRATEFFGDHKREILAAYTQYSGSATEKLLLNAGVRYDHYNDFGNTVNPRLSLVALPTPQTYAKLLYNRAFRAPTFRELYSDNPVVRGDENSDAETIHTYELVCGYISRSRFGATVTFFQNRVRDILTLGSHAELPGVAVYTNSGEIDTYGLEAEIRAQISSATTLTANYAHIEGDVAPGGGASLDLPLVSADIANLIFVKRCGRRLQLGASLQYRGDRERDASLEDPRRPVDGSLVANLNLRAFDVIIPGSEWRLALKNLFDTDYASPSNYPPKVDGVIADDIPNPGFAIVFGFGYTFSGGG